MNLFKFNNFSRQLIVFMTFLELFSKNDVNFLISHNNSFLSACYVGSLDTSCVFFLVKHKLVCSDYVLTDATLTLSSFFFKRVGSCLIFVNLN